MPEVVVGGRRPGGAAGRGWMGACGPVADLRPRGTSESEGCVIVSSVGDLRPGRRPAGAVHSTGSGGKIRTFNFGFSSIWAPKPVRWNVNQNACSRKIKMFHRLSYVRSQGSEMSDARSKGND